MSVLTILSAHAAQDFLLLQAYDVKLQDGKAPSDLTYKVGDEIHLKVVGSGFQDGKVDFPEALSQKEKDETLRLVYLGSSATCGENLCFSMVPTSSGTIKVPSFGIRDSSGRFIGRTYPFSVQVESSIAADDPNPKQPAPPRPPISLEFPWWFILSLCFLGLALLCLVIWLLMRWSRKNRKIVPMFEPQVPLKPEHEWAIEQLIELEKMNYLHQKEFKKHYFGISEILKEYLGRRYEFDAPECTTEELFVYLSDHLKPDELRKWLRNYFIRLDRVKFSDYLPDSLETKEITEKAKEFILKTKRTVVMEPSLEKKNAI